jgi:tRNA (guanine-N7-)-methyltransferase
MERSAEFSEAKRSKEKSFNKDFLYTHKNPYHQKLTDFSEFTLRDQEPEQFQGKWNQQVFDNNLPLHVEVGCGYGHFMLEFCQQNPQVNYVGMDIRFKRTYQLAARMKKQKLLNFRLLRAKGERIAFMFGPEEVDSFYYFFPDPWPKKRHLKKRLFQLPFLEVMNKVLKKEGKVYIKTDHLGYAEWMKEVLENQDLFKVNFHSMNLWNEPKSHFLNSFETKFEKIFREQNVPIKAFELVKK